MSERQKLRATLVGILAVGMWAFLALFTAASGNVPPLQLSAICFAIGGFVGLIYVLRYGSIAVFKQPLHIWCFSILGLFGYHFFYFTALQNAPAAEAGLIAYLWPLLIVVVSAVLPGERLRWFHVTGALLGFLGTFLILTKGNLSLNNFELDSQYAYGYGAALLCAFLWTAYSLLSRYFCDVPTGFVAASCIGTAILSLFGHLLLEETIWPQTGSQWLAIIFLGLFPVGLAFYVWDFGLKKGHIQVIGAASYLAPLFSTVILIAAGYSTSSRYLWLACGLITVGALLAAKNIIGRKT